MDVTRIDSNFAAETVDYEGMTAHLLPEDPFVIDGLFEAEDGHFTRLPKDVALECNENLRAMHLCPAGGRIRFRTDSGRIILRCVTDNMKPYPHQPLTGSHCFDLYVDGEFWNVFRPDFGTDGQGVSRSIYLNRNGYESLLTLGERKMREIEIYFPLYVPVERVWLALEKDAALEAPTPYRFPKPVVFYGTSVTQGGCVTHAGMNYPEIVGRRLQTNRRNLGFSSGGRGEQAMARYLASLDISALVLDYDGNIGDLEKLRTAYEPFYWTVREAKPDLPLIFLNRPVARKQLRVYPERTAIIRGTYEKALSEGDRNVYYIDALSLYAPFGGYEYCTVDWAHNNDLGSYAHALALEPVLRGILESC